MNKKRKKWMRVLCLILLVVLCLGTPRDLSAKTAASSSETETLKLLEGKRAGVMTGTPQDQIIQKNISNVSLQYFNSLTDLVMALQAKKIDFFALATVNYDNMVVQYPELGYLDQTLMTYDIGTIFPKTKKGDTVRKKMNEYIAKIKDSGELEKLQEYWLQPREWKNLDIPKTGKNGVLHMATPNTLKPFSFMMNEKNVGFDIAIAAGFCEEYGYGLQIENVEFAGVLSGITTGKYDMAAGQIAWTQERAESVNYSDFYYTQKIVPIVNASDFAESADLVTAEAGDETGSTSSGSGSVSSSSDKKGIWTSIRKTLIDENRWLSILYGLGVTMVITIVGFLLANVLGALCCAMAMSKSKILHRITGIYSRLMQGLPMVVILMILYYVIFSHSRINNVIVSILGFGLVFGAYMAQLFEGNISGVEEGQWEAALAMGLTKRQTFCGIVFPQAARTMLPGYFSNLISLMKGTAIVGYIAVTDLTKAGDIIRSTTYEAFVPLAVVAIIYLAIACVMIWLMNRIRKKLEPKRLKKIADQKDKGGEVA